LDFLESGLSLASTGLWPRKDFLEIANLPATTQVKLSSNCREMHTYMEQKLCELDRLQLMGKKNWTCGEIQVLNCGRNFFFCFWFEIKHTQKKKKGNKHTHTHMGGNLVLSHHVTLENFHVNCCEEEEEDDDEEEGVMNIQTGLAG
jgi:hypothetical protein